MKAPSLHLPDDVLLDYALGNTTEGASLLAACHLTYCSTCRALVAESERMAGAALDASEGAPLDGHALEHALARLDAVPSEATPRTTTSSVLPPATGPNASDLVGAPVPRPLAASLESINARWRRLVPGVQAIDLPLAAASATARLLKFPPGYRIPLHDHGGPEYSIILSGAISESGLEAGPGDFFVKTGGEPHQQLVATGGVCVALIVNEGPILPLTLPGRLVKALFRV